MDGDPGAEQRHRRPEDQQAVPGEVPVRGRNANAPASNIVRRPGGEVAEPPRDHFEAEHGRAGDAIVRLLRHATVNRYDAHLFAGLVHACRYAGLLDASIAANEEALRLDPNVSTSVEYTLAHFPERIEQAARLTSARPGFLDGIFPALALGDPTNARAVLAEVDLNSVPPALRSSYDAGIAFGLGTADEAVAAIEQAIALHVDPEALFLFGAMLARRGATDRAMDVVEGAVRAGYTPAVTLSRNQAFNELRERDRFKTIEAAAWKQMRACQEMFEAAGGPDMLGMPAATRLGGG